MDSKNLCPIEFDRVLELVADNAGRGGDSIGVDVQDDGEAYEPFLGGGKLLALVDLLPEGEVVVRATVHVGLEWDARGPVEHKVGYLQSRAAVSSD